MKILPASSDGVQLALEAIESGRIVAHATETCYGFACDLTNLSAVEKLFVIKQRLPNQPVSALFSSVDEAKKWVQWNDKAEELAQKYLPGPLTLILPLRSECIGKIFPTPAVDPRAGTPTLGVRISSHPIAQALAEKFGKPLSTTSANLHGKENPYSAEGIQQQYSSDVSDFLILDSGTLEKNPPSTVIDLSGNVIIALREGTINA